MTPKHGHDPTDPRAQRQPPGQQPQGQQPQGQHPQSQQSQGQQPQRQQPQGQPSQGQQPPAGGVGGQPRQSQPGPVGQPPQSGHLGTPQRQSGGQPQQQMGFSQRGPAPGGPNPPRAPQAPPMSGGMQAQTPPQQRWQRQSQQPRRSGQQLLRPVTVDDIAAEDVVTAERDTPIPTAIASMAENDVGSVVVVEDDEPVGVLTDRKVALALENTPEVAQQTVGDLVSEELVTADSSTTIFEVVKMMGDNGIRRVPIVDEDGTLQSIVTLDDAIVLLGTELGNVAETIQAQIDRL